jgi:hypothetical protein
MYPCSYKPVKVSRSRKEKKTLSISQTFRRITVSVPQAPGIEDPLPASMTFYVDSRFTTSQRARKQRLIGDVLSLWNRYYVDREHGVNSPLTRCTANYARFNLAPVWFGDKIVSANVAIDVMMEGLTRMIITNGFGRASRARVAIIPLVATCLSLYKNQQLIVTESIQKMVTGFTVLAIARYVPSTDGRCEASKVRSDLYTLIYRKKPAPVQIPLGTDLFLD